MDMVPLSATARTNTVSASALRRHGKIPCVLYGNAVDHATIACEERALFKAYVKAGESTLVELDVGGKKVPVLFHAIDMDPVSDRIIHVDFYAVDMKREIEAKVPIHVVGIPLAVKDLGGVLVRPHDHVTVRCLPANLPHAIELNVESLASFGQTLTVAALALPKGVTVAEAPDVVLATVQEPRKEEEIAPPPTEAAAEVATEGAATEEAEAKEGAASEAEAKTKAAAKGPGKES